MRIFTNAWFRRFARRENIDNRTLKAAIARADKGLIDVDLGGGVIKQRIARPGKANQEAKEEKREAKRNERKEAERIIEDEALTEVTDDNEA